MATNMAERLKKRMSAKSITAYVMFGAIILVFVFFGLPSDLGQGVGQVARVNNAFVSIADYQQEEQRIQQYYASLFGNAMDFSSQRQLLQQQALENLVRMELVSQAAQKMGVYATDAEIRDFIVKDIPVFQQNGFFQKDLYFRYLEATRTTPADFEAKVRKDIQNIRTRRLFEAATSALAVEKSMSEALRAYKANYAIARIDENELLVGKDNKAALFTREQLDAEIKGLDAALAAGDSAKIESSLARLKTAWEETGLIEIAAENWPKVTSPAVKNAAFDLTKAQPYSKTLVRDGNFKYVLLLKDAKMEAPKAASTEEVMLQRRRGDGLFEAWVNQYRKTSKVDVNTSIFAKQ